MLGQGQEIIKIERERKPSWKEQFNLIKEDKRKPEWIMRYIRLRVENLTLERCHYPEFIL